MTYTLVVGNPTVPANSPYQLINLTENIVLSWPSFYSDGGIPLTQKIDVNPDAGGRTITLPDATLTSEGQDVTFNNISNLSFDILAADGITVLVTVDAGMVINLYLADSSTANGLWRVIPFGAGMNGIINLGATSKDDSIVILNGNITPPGGDIDFALQPSISNLNNITTPGFAVVSDVDPLEWKTTQIIAGHNITITNIINTTGDVTVVELDDSLSSLQEVEVSDFYFSSLGCNANAIDTDLNFGTSGIGVLNFNGVKIDTSGNITTNGDLVVNGSFKNIFMPRVFVTFTDTITGLSNEIVVEDYGNASSVTGGKGIYNINFAQNLPTNTYGVLFGFGSSGGELPPTYNGVWTVRETSFVTIAITDSGGQLVSDIPFGVCVMIMAAD